MGLEPPFRGRGSGFTVTNEKSKSSLLLRYSLTLRSVLVNEREIDDQDDRGKARIAEVIHGRDRACRRTCLPET